MSIRYTIDNTFIFSFVRMNPPTPGHLELIKTMINKGIDLGTNKAYIITSSSMDGKNPLACSSETIPKPKNKSDASVVDRLIHSDSVYKSYILDKMVNSYKHQLALQESDPIKSSLIEHFEIIILCSTGNPFGFIYNIIKNGYIDRGITKINMVFIVGRDRADFLDTIVDSFKDKDYINSIDGIILEREGMESLKTSGMGVRTISEISPSEYSASFIRKLVYEDKKGEFQEVYNPYLSPDEIEQLFNTIKIGIEMKSPSPKYEEENPESRYFDRHLLPIINTSQEMSPEELLNKRQKKAGSKRRKTKTKNKNKGKTRKIKRKNKKN